MIRISRGERDASARATHLEAATRKFLVTTNERKQMSTKTNFKRIALVAIAALGMGVLSAVPSSAAFTGTAGSQLTVTASNGTAGLTGAASDSTTAGTITVSGFALLGTDSFTVVVSGKTKPAAQASFPLVVLALRDTLTSTSKVNISKGTGTQTDQSGSALGTTVVSAPAGNLAPGTTDTSTIFGVAPASSSTVNSYVAATFLAYMDSYSSTRVAGTYTYTVVATPVNIATPGTAQTVDISFTVAAAASASTTIVPGSSTAFIGTSTGATSDAAITAVATASATPAAYVNVKTYNTVTTAAESITATISGAGILHYGGISGASLTIAGTGNTDIEVRPNGTAGVATISISTTTRTFPAKTMTFYATAPTKLVATAATPLLAIGSNSDAVRVTATDANGTLWAGTLYVWAVAAADEAVASAARASASSCSFDSVDNRHECSVTGIAAGTANLRISNYATAALATAAASGAEVTADVKVVVSQAAVASVKLEFDKATYAPGERARIYVTPLDSTGKPMQVATYSNLLAAGGISTASALTFAGSTTTADSLTAVSITTKANTSAATGAKAGSMEYTVYMPLAGGTVTISATGGTTLPLAGRVAVSASATVTDSGAAALAAVNALATTVASLKTLITTLTNLVLKIQKKVKA